MDLDQSSLAAKLTGADAPGPHLTNALQTEVLDAQKAEPKSYLDKVVGVVVSNDKVERNIVEAAKTGSVFLNGNFGLASSLALYALDQVKVGDSLPQVAIDAGLGLAKGIAMRGLNQSVVAADLGIAGQGFMLGTGARLLESGLDRRTWIDSGTSSFDVQKGKSKLLGTLTDRSALAADLGTFVLGGALSAGLNKVTENSLQSSPFFRTVLTGGVFGLASGSTSEINAERERGQSLNLGKIIGAGGEQAFFSAASSIPAGSQASYAVHNTYLDSYGVRVVGEKGAYKFGYKADGAAQTLFEVPAGLKNLREAGARLNLLSEQRQSDLAQSFGISFARAGESVTFKEGPGLTTLSARAPRLNELVAMENALKKSQPGQLTLNGKTGAKFNFIQDKDAPHLGFGGLFEFHGETPNIFLHNELNQSKPITERDPDVLQTDYEDRKRNSLEGVATHEIAHHTDMKVRGLDPALEASLRENIGWQRFRDGDFYEFDTHLLKGKDGAFYRFAHAGRTWTRSDAGGNAIDLEGKAAAPGAEVRLTNEEMIARAQVRPISDYFNNPTEMLMEGFLNFRVGGENRAKLLRESPVLYDQVKLQDNRELAAHYGFDASGQSRMVRLPDGTLAERNAESLKAISNFETTSAAEQNLPPGFTRLRALAVDNRAFPEQ